MLMFDIYHGSALSYMLELYKRCTDSRLCSAAHGDFIIPRTRLRFTVRILHCSRSTGVEYTTIKTAYFSLQRHIPWTS